MSAENAFRHLLKSSIAQEKRASLLAKIIFAVMVLAAVGLYLWRCHYGVDLTDEAFYSLPAWKMFGLGDRPFVDEMYNGMRHSDLLNYVFIRPWVPFSLLLIRQSAVAIYALVLLAYCLFFFQGRLGFTAGLAFAICLTFDYFLVPSWSYNWWARDFLLLHNLGLMLWSRTENEKLKNVALGAAGLCLGVLVVAYNSLLPALPIIALVLWCTSRLWARPLNLTVYLWASFLVPLADLFFIWRSALTNDWLLAVKSMTALTEYSKDYALEKALHVFKFILSNFSLPSLLLLLIVGFVESDWMQWMGNVRHTLIERNKLVWLLVGCSFFGIGISVSNLNDPLTLLAGVVGLGTAGAILLGMSAWRERSVAIVAVVVTSLLVTFGIALSSTNQFLALYWSMPALIIPLLGRVVLESEFRSKGVTLFWRLREGVGHLGLLLFLAILALGIFKFQWLHTYYDVPPGNCETEIKTGPMAKLRTSPRRAFLVSELNRLVGGREFVVSFAENPGVLVSGMARSAVDTTMVEPGAPLAIKQRSLEHMLDRHRIPSLAIRSKVRAWYWGIHHPFSQSLIAYPADDPYNQFVDCAQKKRLVEYQEFEAFEINVAKAADCVAKIKKGPAWLANARPFKEKR